MIRHAVLLSLASATPAYAQHDHHHATTPQNGDAAPETPRPAETPPPPGDHAADAYFEPAEMAAARRALRHENGGMGAAMLLLDQFELQSGGGRDGYRWEGEAWSGGDIDRLVIKSEGEGAFSGALEQAEVQALYSHALDPWFNLQLGVRHDIRPEPQRSYAVIAVEGLAPFWFEVEGSLFLSDKGDLAARVEASHDIRLTQRLLLTPRVEFNLSAQDVAALGQGSGLTSTELGLRLYYAITPRLAPYIGIHWEGLSGGSARFARAAGDGTQRTSFVAGVRAWF